MRVRPGTPMGVITMLGSRLLSTICVVLFLTMCHSTSLAGSNCFTTLALHARSGWTDECLFPGQPDCRTVFPNVQVQPNGQYRVYLYMQYTEGATLLQTAFAWPEGWTLVQSLWNCRSNQVVTQAPDPNSQGGAIAGTLVTTFDCVTTPNMVPLGFMDFQVGNSGCLTQIQSAYPFGTHMEDCRQRISLLWDPERLGSVCVGPGGYRPCEPPVLPPSPCFCSAGGPYSGQTGIPVEFSGTSDLCHPPLLFTWDFGDGSTGSGQATTHVYSAPGVYDVTFNVTEEGYCDLSWHPHTTATITTTTSIPPASSGPTPATWGQIKATSKTD